MVMTKSERIHKFFALVEELKTDPWYGKLIERLRLPDHKFAGALLACMPEFNESCMNRTFMSFPSADRPKQANIVAELILVMIHRSPVE